MAEKKILITGTNGFVGKNLKEYFLSGARDVAVLSPLRGELNLLDADAVRAYITSSEPDLVIHCATIGGARKTGYDAGAADVVAGNLRMFMNLARCLGPGMRMISMGSGAEYDKRYGVPKITEESFDAHVPADDYGYAKYLISKYIEKAGNITCLRIFGLYGKYEDYTFKFISNAIVKNLLGLPIVINQNVVFDYLWIGDFCELVGRLSEKAPTYAHYNITPADPVDLVSLAEMVNSAGKNKSEVKVLNPGMNTEYTGSSERLVKELGGFNFTSYEEGIRQLYLYYASKLNELDLETVRKDPYLKFCKKADSGTAGKP